MQSHIFLFQQDNTFLYHYYTSIPKTPNRPTLRQDALQYEIHLDSRPELPQLACLRCTYHQG